MKGVYEILNEKHELTEIIDRNIFVHDIDKQDNVHKQHNHHLQLAKIERQTDSET